MGDLRAERAAFQASLENEKNGVKTLTLEDCKNSDNAWHVLSVLSNPGTKNKDTNDISEAAKLAQKLFEPKEIGEGIRKRNGEREVRTNIMNIRTMYAIHGKIRAMALAETSDKYFSYYENIYKYLNEYAIEVVTDMAEEDAELFNKIAQIDTLAKDELDKRLKAAREKAKESLREEIIKEYEESKANAE